MRLESFARVVALPAAIALALAGCQAPGENLKPNVYRADQVNTAQGAKVVNILAVFPAQIEADNSQQKAAAQVAGGVLGAVGGGVIGSNITRQKTTGAVLGAAGGGVAGTVAGSLVPDKVLVDGVSLTYEVDGQTLNSAQVGKQCEYVPGKAVVISTSPTETRIQPNATCPQPSGT